MAFEQKDGDIAVYKNHMKTEEKHPDLTGSMVINGEKRSISLWQKKGPKGIFYAGKHQPYRNPGEAKKYVEKPVMDAKQAQAPLEWDDGDKIHF